jgi:hypothetical protein
MKQHELKRREKQRAIKKLNKKKEKTKGDKKPNQKRRKDNKILSKKNEKGVGNFF